MTADELRAWRTERGLGPVALARALHVSYETVRRWEIGARAMPGYLPLALAGLDQAGATQKEHPKP